MEAWVLRTWAWCTKIPRSIFVEHVKLTIFLTMVEVGLYWSSTARFRTVSSQHDRFGTRSIVHESVMQKRFGTSLIVHDPVMHKMPGYDLVCVPLQLCTARDLARLTPSVRHNSTKVVRMNSKLWKLKSRSHRNFINLIDRNEGFCKS